MHEKNQFFRRYSRFNDTATGSTMCGAAGGVGFGLGGYGGTSLGANDSVALGTDIAINANLVTDVRLGYFRYNINTAKYDQGVNLATQLGIPGMNPGTAITSAAPSFQLTEVCSLSGASPANPPTT